MNNIFSQVRWETDRLGVAMRAIGCVVFGVLISAYPVWLDKGLIESLAVVVLICLLFSAYRLQLSLIRSQLSLNEDRYHQLALTLEYQQNRYQTEQEQHHAAHQVMAEHIDNIYQAGQNGTQVASAKAAFKQAVQAKSQRTVEQQALRRQTAITQKNQSRYKQLVAIAAFEQPVLFSLIGLTTLVWLFPA